jgi:hypothetical protein
MPKIYDPEDRKVPFTVSLSPRQSRYAMREARRMQISLADVIRRLIDREIEQDERQPPMTRLSFRA